MNWSLKKRDFARARSLFKRKDIGMKRYFMAFIGVVFIGFSVAVLNLSGFGVDPFSCMNMSVSAHLPFSFGVWQIFVNAVILMLLVIHVIKGRAAVRAVQLAGQQIVVIAKILPPLDILAAAGEDSVCCVPQLLGYDGRYDFTALILEHHPLLRREKLLLFSEHIHDAHFVADIIALVLRVGNHAGHGRVGDFSAVMVAEIGRASCRERV